ncbi:hypothetical protein [Paraburkholderia sp. RL17-337-BIB-A]
MQRSTHGIAASAGAPAARHSRTRFVVLALPAAGTMINSKRWHMLAARR